MRRIQPKASVGANIRMPALFIVSGGFPATMSMPVSRCIRSFASKIHRRSRQRSRRNASAAGHAAGVWRNRKNARRRSPPPNARKLHCIQHKRETKPVAVKGYWFLSLPYYPTLSFCPHTMRMHHGRVILSSEGSRVTHDLLWPARDPSLPLRMTRQGRYCCS